jgi:hypothetical protein
MVAPGSSRERLAQLVGDLQLRHRRGGLQDRVSRSMITVVTTLEKLFQDETSDTLLALNWDDHIGELLIGRSLSCDLMLVDPTVSGRVD